MDDERTEQSSLEDMSDQSKGIQSQGDGRPSKKRSRRKLLIVLAAIAVIVVSAGIGGVIWHGHPGFCNALCHDPMDPYVEGYYSGDNNLLVTAHADAQKDCLDCHVATVGQQISEAGSWISGSYKNPLPMTKTGTRDFCLACHDNDEIKAATVNYAGTARNPHDSHYGDALECYTCHRAHRVSTMYCNECHPDIKGPSGWES
jgi:hypothetical protein